MFAHDLAKIKLVESGYLPNYPYHLISDKELFDAFMDCTNETGYFFDNYPMLRPDLYFVYQQLVLTIQYYLLSAVLLESTGKPVEIPDWVYSYMLGYAISVNSDKKDIHDLLVAMHLDNIDDDFNQWGEVGCKDVSDRWIMQMNLNKTIKIPEAISDEMIAMLSERSIQGISLYDVYLRNRAEGSDGGVQTRPTTLFGEAHVIKALRLAEAAM